MHIQKKYLKHVFLGLVFLCGVFSYAPHASAASITFVPSVSSGSVGDTIRIRVAVSSDSSINAVSAKITYSNEILSLTSISKAGSIVNLWAQEPSYSNSTGSANFEGVVLNGYTGSSGTIVTLMFKAKAPGVASLRFSQASILANDGNGTEISSTKGTGSVTVAQATQRVVTKEEPVVETKTQAVSSVIKIEELTKANDKTAPKRFLITAPRPAKDRAYIIAIDSMEVISWIDDGSHIYQVPDLVRGIHTLKVTAKDMNGVTMSGFTEFSTTTISTPVITDYPAGLFVNDFLILKGTADPLVDVNVIITNINTTEAVTARIQANSTGKWSFVSEEKMTLGTYSIVARAITKDGIESNPSKPLRIDVRPNAVNKFFTTLGKYLTVITPTIALLVLLIFIILYGIYYLRKTHRYLKQRLIDTETVIAKSFEVLESDMEEQVNIFRKIKARKPLTESEKTFLVKFKKDIESAEKIILKEMKDLEKEE